MLKKIILTEEQENHWKKIASKLNKSVAEALTDPFFYYYLNDKKIKSFDDLNCIQIDGLINNPKNQIEIWYQGKKVQKIKINDLNNDFLLFPLYNTSIKKIDVFRSSGIYIEQKEIGLIGSYEIKNTIDFKIENIEFKLIKYGEKLLVSEILYKDLPIQLKRKDSNINYLFSYSIDYSLS